MLMQLLNWLFSKEKFAAKLCLQPVRVSYKKYRGNAAGLVVVSLALLSISATLLSNMSSDEVMGLEQTGKLQEQLVNYGELCLNDSERIIDESWSQVGSTVDTSPGFYELNYAGWDRTQARVINPPTGALGSRDVIETRSFYAPAARTDANGSVINNFINRGFQQGQGYIYKDYSSQYQGRPMVFRCKIAHDTTNHIYGLKRYANVPDNKKVQVSIKMQLLETSQNYEAKRIFSDDSMNDRCVFKKEDAYVDLPDAQKMTTAETPTSLAVGNFSSYFTQIGNNKICYATRKKDATGNLTNELSCHNMTANGVADPDFDKKPFYLIGSFRNNYSGNLGGVTETDNRFYWTEVYFKVTDPDPAQRKGTIVVFSKSVRSTNPTNVTTSLVFQKRVNLYPADLNVNNVQRYFKLLAFPASKANNANQVTVVYQRDHATNFAERGLYSATFKWSNINTASIPATQFPAIAEDVGATRITDFINNEDAWDLNPDSGKLVVVHKTPIASNYFRSWQINYDPAIPSTLLNSPYSLPTLPDGRPTLPVTPISNEITLGSQYATSVTGGGYSFITPAWVKVTQVIAPSDKDGVALFVAKWPANEVGVYALSLNPSRKITNDGKLSANGVNAANLMNFPITAGRVVNNVYLTSNNNQYYWVAQTPNNANADTSRDKVFRFSAARFGYPSNSTDFSTNKFINVQSLSGTYLNVFQYKVSLLSNQSLWSSLVTAPPQFAFTKDDSFALRNDSRIYYAIGGQLKEVESDLNDSATAGNATKTLVYKWPYVYFTDVKANNGGLYGINVLTGVKEDLGLNIDFNSISDGAGGIFFNPEFKSVFVLTGKDSFNNGKIRQYTPTCTDREFLTGEYKSFDTIGYDKTKYLQWPDDHGSASTSPARLAGL